MCELGIESWIAQQKAAGRIKQIAFRITVVGAISPSCSMPMIGTFVRFNTTTLARITRLVQQVLKLRQKRGLAVFIMEPLLGGRLADKLPQNAASIFEKAATPQLATPAAWGLSGCGNHPEVTMVLSGMNTIAQLDENANPCRSCTAQTHLPHRIMRLSSVFERCLNSVIEYLAQDVTIACRVLRESIFPDALLRTMQALHMDGLPG